MLKVGSFSISRFLEDVSMELFEGTTEGKEPRDKQMVLYKNGETKLSFFDFCFFSKKGKRYSCPFFVLAGRKG